MQTLTSPTQDYHIICDDGHEYRFQAIDDSHAIGLSQKQYPAQKWKLFRVSQGQETPVCDQSPDCPPG